MGFFWRAARTPVVLSAMFLIVLGTAQAQDAPVVVGSGVAAPLVTALAEAEGFALSVTPTGTNRGFASFCSGETAATLSTRPISASEESACGANSVRFYELVTGYNALAMVSSADAAFEACFTQSALNTLLVPSAAGQVIDWSQVNGDNAGGALQIVVPELDSAAYALLDNAVEGDGLRADVTYAADAAQALEVVTADANAIAFIAYADALAAGDSVRIGSLNTSAVGCADPSPTSFADRSYALAEPAFIYVNADLADEPLVAFLTAATGEAAAETVANAGFVPAPPFVTALNGNILAAGNDGREFSRYVTAYQIPQSVTGTVTIAGSASARGYVDRIANAFTSAYPGVTRTLTLLGEEDGYRRLCNGEADLVFTPSAMSAEQQANCEANNVVPVSFSLGSTAAVLVANASDEALACLTTEQIAAAWSASETPATAWSDVGDSLGDGAITLLAPPAGSYALDLALAAAGATGGVSRLDSAVIVDEDPLYRAAATANVESAMTILSWDEYQSVLDNDQQNIQVVAVDAGNGCVMPGEATIADQTYALAQPLTMTVSQAALTRAEVQSLTWFLASDEQYDILQNSGIAGLPFSGLEPIRNTLQDTFAEAAASAAQAAEATPEATPEATSEATPEAEMTPEATAAS
jgi:phosphate transport system substrate-binding protein